MLLEIHALIERCVALVASGGPWIFFTAMALLPAAGFPLSFLSLAAGPAFGPSMGMGWVVAAGLSAATFNIILTYALARRALRPFLEKVMGKWANRLPKLDGGDSTDLILVIRFTPGIPFFAQNYLLGLANVPFGRYLLISCAQNIAYTGGCLLFGDALLHGKGKRVMIATGILVLAVVVTHFLRRHLSRGKLQHAPVG